MTSPLGDLHNFPISAVPLTRKVSPKALVAVGALSLASLAQAGPAQDDFNVVVEGQTVTGNVADNDKVDTSAGPASFLNIGGPQRGGQ